MDANKLKIILLVAILMVVTILTTCQYNTTNEKTENINSDTLFLSQWRREKQDKKNVISSYEERIKVLQLVGDTLRKQLGNTKYSLAMQQEKKRELQLQLKQTLDTYQIAKPVKYNIASVLDSMIVSSNETDTACNETIKVLERTVSNEDSIISDHVQIEQNYKDVQKLQDLKDQYSTQQLNQSLKAQRKLSRRNKLLSAGLLILTGITTSLLISQTLK